MALQENIIRRALKELTETKDWNERATIINGMSNLLDLLKGETPDYMFMAEELLKYIDTTYLYTDAEHQTLYNVIMEV
jgi:hypothetical protein